MSAAGRVAGKVALISGGARGLGASHARLLAAEGARVVIGDVLDGSGLAAELGPERARAVHLDVTGPASWEAAVATALEAFGRLDVLVNNAGLLVAAPIEEHTLEDWHRVVDVNLHGTFHGIRACIPALRESGRGSIVNVSSTAGLVGHAGLPGYTATKFAIRGLTKSAALDLGRYGIRVNSVHPGRIPTPMVAGMHSATDLVALRRDGEALEVSRLVLFLASDESSFSTGAEFVVDGGKTAGLAAP